MSLDIVHSDKVLTSWGDSSSHNGASSSSPITRVSVDSKVPMHQWRLLHKLPALRSLIINYCCNLKASPEIIQHLTSLEELYFKYLSLDKTSLPHWLGQLTSLKKLEIEYCRGIRSLPDNIQQLTKLEYLHIIGRPTLKKWCESEENKMKLAHIRKAKYFGAKDHDLGWCVGTRHMEKMKEVGHEIVDDETWLIDAMIGLMTGPPKVVGLPLNSQLYNAVMYMPGFAELDLLFAVLHLKDNYAQAAVYMDMREEDRVSWLMDLLRKKRAGLL